VPKRVTNEEQLLLFIFHAAAPGKPVSNSLCQERLALSPKRFEVTCNLLAHGNFIKKNPDGSIHLTPHGINTCQNLESLQ
jgi:Mn-dependent DtxR family transcriptional regulator